MGVDKLDLESKGILCNPMSWNRFLTFAVISCEITSLENS